jgi:hypothetical protein
VTAGWVEGTSWSEGRADVVGIEREAIVISINLADTHKGIVIVDTVKVVVALVALLWIDVVNALNAKIIRQTRAVLRARDHSEVKVR